MALFFLPGHVGLSSFLISWMKELGRQAEGGGGRGRGEQGTDGTSHQATWSPYASFHLCGVG